MTDPTPDEAFRDMVVLTEELGLYDDESAALSAAYSSRVSGPSFGRDPHRQSSAQQRGTSSSSS